VLTPKFLFVIEFVGLLCNIISALFLPNFTKFTAG